MTLSTEQQRGAATANGAVAAAEIGVTMVAVELTEADCARAVEKMPVETTAARARSDAMRFMIEVLG